MPEWLNGALGTAGTILIGFLTWMATRRSGDRSRIVALEVRLDAQQLRIDALDRRDARKSDFIRVLKRHIDTEQGPPSPPYPENFFD